MSKSSSDLTSNGKLHKHQLLTNTPINNFDVFAPRFLQTVTTQFRRAGKMLSDNIVPSFHVPIPDVLKPKKRSPRTTASVARSKATTPVKETSSSSSSDDPRTSLAGLFPSESHDDDEEEDEETVQATQTSSGAFTTPLPRVGSEEIVEGPLEEEEERHREFLQDVAKTEHMFDVQEMRKLKAKFTEDCIGLTAYIEYCMSDSSLRLISSHGDFQRCKRENDALGMWKIVVEKHIVEPGKRDIQIANESLRLRNMRMDDEECKQMDFEAYQALVLLRFNRLIYLGERPSERNAVNDFLMSLDSSFERFIEDIYQHGPMPQSLLEAIDSAREYTNTKTLVNKARNKNSQKVKQQTTKNNTNSQNTIEEVANYGDSRFRGGKSKNNARKSDDKKPVNKQYTEKHCSFCAKHRPAIAHTHNTVECRQKDKDNSSSGGGGDSKKGGAPQSDDTKKRNAKKSNETVSFASAQASSCDDSDGEVILFTVDVDKPPVHDRIAHSEAIDESAFLSAELVDEIDVGSADVLLLDSGSTAHIIRDSALLRCLCASPRSRVISGVGSTTVATHEGELEHFGNAISAPGSPANIISMGKAKHNGFKLELSDADSLGRQSFTLKSPDVELVFHENHRGLFVHRIANGHTALFGLDTSQLPQLTRVDTDTHVTVEQLQRAREAIVLHQMFDHASDAALCKALDNGAFLNCHLCSSDLRMARKLYGNFCAGCLQGKMTRAIAVTSQSEPAHHVGQVQHADLLFVLDVHKKKIPYILSVDEHSGYICSYRMTSKGKKDMEQAMIKMINVYSSFGHTVKTWLADRENAFTAARDALSTRGVELKQSSPEHHEHRAERAIRSLKDRMRSTLSQLPYTLPRVLMKELLAHAVNSMNLLPNKQSGVRSPREIVTGVKTDMKTALRAPFGTIVLCKVPNQTVKDDMEPRAEHGIVVGRDLHSAGNIKVFLLKEQLVVNRHQFRVVPHTTDLIAAINAISSRDPVVTASDSTVLHDRIDFESDTVDDDTSVDPPDVPSPPVEDEIFDGQPPTPTPPAEPEPAAETHRGAEAETLPQRGGDPDPVAVAPTVPTEHRGEVEPPPERGVDPVPAAPRVASRAASKPAQRTQQPQPQSQAAYGLRPKRSRYQEYGLHITMSKGIQMYGERAHTAAKHELEGQLDMDTWDAVFRSSISKEDLSKIIPSSLFFKEKFFPDGEFDKLKARLVGNGNFQELTDVERQNSSSPTVSTTSVLAVIGIAAHKKWNTRVIDFASAYLNASLGSIRQYMNLSPKVVQILLEIRPEMAKFRNADGTITVKLKKAIYGLTEAAKLWYEHLCKKLAELGYTKSTADSCVFYKRDPKSPEDMCILCVHIDDCLVTGEDALLDELEAFLAKRYKNLSVARGDTLAYTGMEIIFDRVKGTATLRQSGYVDDMMRIHNITGTAATPATQNLFTIPAFSKPIEQKPYLSKLMKALYLAKRTRSDTLLALAYLATHSAQPTEDDDQKLTRVYMYVNGTRNKPLVLRPDSLDIYAFVDASFGSHPDAKGHTGIILTLGRYGGPIYAQSTKQKLVTKSSTESELVGLDDGLGQVLWARSFMKDLGFLRHEPTVVFQDNQSTMLIAERGPGQKGRTKHIDIRYYYITEKIKNGDIELRYLSSEEMLADLLTKPLAYPQFTNLRDQLLEGAARE